eukprot:3534563-Lingulodinium_polyedra.AAC.1
MATIMVVGGSGIMAVSLVVVMAVIATAMHTCSRLVSPPEQVPPRIGSTCGHEWCKPTHCA